MKKRIKSGLITLVSILGVVMVSPQFIDFTKFASDKLSEWGVPVAVIGLLGVFLSEIWKQILNWRITSKLEKEGLAGSSADYSNELY
jgi:hypothetical protein